MTKTSLVVNYFKTLSPIYDKKSASRHNYNSSINAHIIEFLKNCSHKKAVLLDAGCGTGTRIKPIFKQFPRFTYYSCDICPEMVNLASTKKLFKKVFLSSITKLPLKAKSVDIITCLFNTFGYLSSTAERNLALAEFYRVLKPGGFLFIDVMNLWHVGEGLSYHASFKKLATTWLLSKLDPNLESGDQIFHAETTGFVHGFTQSEMKHLITSSKLSLINSHIIGYDSGTLKKYFWQGQFFYICQKT